MDKFQSILYNIFNGDIILTLIKGAKMNGLVVFGEAATQATVATQLENGLSADAFWGAVSPFIPVIITVTLVSLGYYMIRRITKKFSRGKGGA